ncbi:MAG: winged helix-turn-helix domain-containing protein [Acidobacteriota bacterium]
MPEPASPGSAPPAAPAGEFAFGSFLLSPSRFELCHQGRPLKLEPRVLELLVYLVRHRQRVVSKDELVARVWQVEYASDAVLTRAVAQARRALSHDGGGAAYIQTVHGRGYRFVAAVEEIPDPSPPPDVSVCEQGRGPAPGTGDQARPAANSRRRPFLGPGRRAVTLGGAALLLAGLGVSASFLWRNGSAALGRPITLVVPPFLVAGGDTELEIAASTLRHFLLRRLEEDPHLRVLEGEPQEPPWGRWGSAAQAEPPHVLAGTVNTGRTGWGVVELKVHQRRDNAPPLMSPVGVYDFPLLARASGLSAFVERRDPIVAAAYHDITAALASHPASPVRGVDRDTLHLLLLAHDHLQRGGGEVETAQRLLEQVLERDPTFAQGWITYGWTLYSLGSFSGRGGNHYRLALAAAERARTLKPQAHQPYVIAALVEVETGHAEIAYAHLLEGLERLPEEPALHYFASYVLRYAGMLSASRQALQRALELDPLVMVRNGGAPNTFLYLHEMERFVASLPGLPTPLNLFYQGFAGFLMGEEAAHREALQQAFQLSTSDQFSRLAAALLALEEGRRGDVLTVLRQLQLQRRALDAGDGEFTYKIAQLAALAGEGEFALQCLREAVEQGFFCPPCLADPTLRSVSARSTARALLAAAVERQSAFAARFGLPLTEVDRAAPPAT